jgi:hypothetical protein
VLHSRPLAEVGAQFTDQGQGDDLVDPIERRQVQTNQQVQSLPDVELGVVRLAALLLVRLA